MPFQRQSIDTTQINSCISHTNGRNHFKEQIIIFHESPTVVSTNDETNVVQRKGKRKKADLQKSRRARKKRSDAVRASLSTREDGLGVLEGVLSCFSGRTMTRRGGGVTFGLPAFPTTTCTSNYIFLPFFAEFAQNFVKKCRNFWKYTELRQLSGIPNNSGKFWWHFLQKIFGLVQGSAKFAKKKIRKLPTICEINCLIKQIMRKNEVGVVQQCVDLVDLVKSFQTNVYLQKSASYSQERALQSLAAFLPLIPPWVD